MLELLRNIDMQLMPVSEPLHAFLGTMAGAVVLAAVSIVGMRKGLPVVLQDSLLFKIFSVALLLFGYTRSITASVVIVGVVLVSYNLLVAKSPAFELYTDLYAQTVVPPHCKDILFADILAAYNNNMDHLLDDLVQSGLPKNVKLNDEFAPLISTYLLKLGNDVCAKK